MAIEFRCGSIVSFDSAQKKYVTCDAKISVKDDLRGSVIACPKCKNKVEVPYAAPDGASSPVSGPAIAEIEAEPLGDLEHAVHATTSPAKSKQRVGAKRAKGPKPGESGNTVKSEKPVQAEVLAAPSPAFERPESQLGYSTFTRDNICLKCGADIRSAVDTCPKCGRPLPAHLQKSERSLEARHKLVGFQLWIATLFSSPDTQPPAAAKGLFHTAMGGAVGMASFALIYFGGLLGLITALPLILLAVMYTFTALKWEQWKKDPHSEPYWFQKLLWTGLLQVFRILKWQNSTDPAKKHRVLDMRYTTIDENQLRDLDGIAHSQVLDLQGQPITDSGLLYLHEFKQLRRIVLRGTNVTSEGVFHLQQAIPRAWIWY